MIVITGYQGGAYDEDLASVYNKCMSVRGFIAERTVSAEEIRRLWFEYSTFSPRDFAIVVNNDRVYGMVFTSVGIGFGRIWICIDPFLPRYYVLETLSHLLSWARQRFLKEHVPIIRISCGYEYSVFHMLLREILGLGIEYTITVLMEYTGGIPSYSLGSDVVIRRGTIDDVPGVVEVWNSAFRRYSWFEEWNVDDAIKWYSSRNLILLIAVDRKTGEIIGFIDAEERKGFDGNIYGYIYTLGVHPKNQGRGVGSALLKSMIRELKKHGAKNIYLDAIDGLENYYVKRGFSILRRSIALIVCLENLPQRVIPLLNLQFNK